MSLPFTLSVHTLSAEPLVVSQDALAVTRVIPAFTVETEQVDISPSFEPSQTLPIDVSGLHLPTRLGLLTANESWAVFYWRNRYYIPEGDGEPAPQERSLIIDMDLVLHERALADEAQ